MLWIYISTKFYYYYCSNGQCLFKFTHIFAFFVGLYSFLHFQASKQVIFLLLEGYFNILFIVCLLMTNSLKFLFLKLTSFYLHFCFVYTYGMWKFPGQGLNSCCSFERHHRCSNIRSLTHCTTGELPHFHFCWEQFRRAGIFLFVKLSNCIWPNLRLSRELHFLVLKEENLPTSRTSCQIWMNINLFSKVELEYIITSLRKNRTPCPPSPVQNK